MKTFVTVFSSILAAALVIVLGLYCWTRLAEWERAKGLCYAQISSEGDSATARTSRDQADMHGLAAHAEDFHDVVELADRGAASLQAMQDSQNRILKLEQTLVALLETKPFGLPLTADERKELESLKADVKVPRTR